MRKAFIDTITSLSGQDKDIYLLTADMGFGLVESFATRFPRQYINVGVAEQNMIGVATGLALEDKKVFCYSIANFPTMRCLEQIRNDVCYHNLPVCIVSGGAGLWYGALGMTHHAVEDIAVMRCLPNITIIAPSNEKAMADATKASHLGRAPCYIRLTRTELDNTRTSTTQVGNAKYSDIVIIATGGRMFGNATQAGEQLASGGIQTSVLLTEIIKPLDTKPILNAIIDRSVQLVLTIEEHSRIGGLGSAIAELLAGMKQHPPLVRLGTGDCYPTTAMSYEELLRFHHLDVDSIVQKVLDALR